eukprot:TRINITY_DN9646_c0_g1_i1.p1 TRINITY_DN9646_c0_g1~~TRINITY_DN9646_c0_g1_i1.p1  ORF type:complete len:282 (+),score=42.35 TRINITY_DN9646_c0_g1_i1:483-1328(+)
MLSDSVDDEGMPPELIRSVAAKMEQCSGDGGVLVHCSSGTSRSAAIVLGWLMCHRQASLQQAVDIVSAARGKRLAVRSAYWKSLHQLEREINSDTNPPSFDFTPFVLMDMGPDSDWRFPADQVSSLLTELDWDPIAVHARLRDRFCKGPPSMDQSISCGAGCGFKAGWGLGGGMPGCEGDHDLCFSCFSKAHSAEQVEAAVLMNKVHLCQGPTADCPACLAYTDNGKYDGHTFDHGVGKCIRSLEFALKHVKSLDTNHPVVIQANDRLQQLQEIQPVDEEE